MVYKPICVYLCHGYSRGWGPRNDVGLNCWGEIPDKVARAAELRRNRRLYCTNRVWGQAPDMEGMEEVFTLLGKTGRESLPWTLYRGGTSLH
jgi:hypothetical protein